MSFCPGGQFIVMFAALPNREYFGSEDETNGSGKWATRAVRYTIGLEQEKQYQTHHAALKMSFRRDGDLLPSSGLYLIASILIQKMGPTDLEGGQQGKWRCTIGLKQKTQYQTHYGAVKISFRRADNSKRYTSLTATANQV
jgi:hypothetical protein